MNESLRSRPGSHERPPKRVGTKAMDAWKGKAAPGAAALAQPNLTGMLPSRPPITSMLSSNAGSLPRARIPQRAASPRCSGVPGVFLGTLG